MSFNGGLYTFLLWAAPCALLASAPAASAADLAHFETVSHNAIGERVLTVTVRDHGRDYFKLSLPVAPEAYATWQKAGHLHLDWTHCRSTEMLAAAGELTQCVRRAQLTIAGEDDVLAPAVLDLDLDASGRLSGSYRPDPVAGATPFHFTAEAEVAAVDWQSSQPYKEMVKLQRTPEHKLSPTGQAATKFLFFGDAGTGDKHQYAVARGLTDYCNRSRSDCGFILMMGDNFYQNGVTSTTDSQWETKFERPYRDLGTDFYPVLGNHDHHGDIEAQLAYTEVQPRWKMQARYYAFDQGDVAFFGIDSDDFDSEQAAWLRSALAASTKAWKIVYAHHPVYSYGSHSDTDYLKHDLLPLHKEAGVDFYLCGHDHDKQVIERDGLTFIVTGTAGAHLTRVDEGEGTVFAASTYGFSHLSISATTAHLDILDQAGRVEFTRDYAKAVSGSPAQPVTH